MPNYIVQGSDLSSVASAIRTKGGTSDQLAFPAGFVSAIEALPSGGGSKTYGLIATINISQAVGEVVQSLPDLVVEDGYLVAVFDSVTVSDEDYLYAGVVPSDQNAVWLNSYTAKATTFSFKQINMFSKEKSIDSVSVPGYASACTFDIATVHAGGKTVTYGVNSPVFKARTYGGTHSITGGTIYLYGRTA